MEHRAECGLLVPRGAKTAVGAPPLLPKETQLAEMWTWTVSILAPMLPSLVCGRTAWAFPATAELFQEDQAEGEEPPQAH